MWFFNKAPKVEVMPEVLSTSERYKLLAQLFSKEPPESDSALAEAINSQRADAEFVKIAWAVIRLASRSKTRARNSPDDWLPKEQDTTLEQSGLSELKTFADLVILEGKACERATQIRESKVSDERFSSLVVVFEKMRERLGYKN